MGLCFSVSFRAILDASLAEHTSVRLLRNADEHTALGVLCDAFEGDKAFMWTHEQDSLPFDEMKARYRVLIDVDAVYLPVCAFENHALVGADATRR
jgi:hypothetical protein